MFLHLIAVIFLTLSFLVIDATVSGSQQTDVVDNPISICSPKTWTGSPDVINTPLIPAPQPQSLSPELTYISAVMGISITHPQNAIVESPEIGTLKVIPQEFYSNKHLQSQLNPALTFELINLPLGMDMESYVNAQLALWQLDSDIAILSETDITIGQLSGVTVSIYDLGEMDIRYLALSENQLLIIINPLINPDYSPFDQVVINVLNPAQPDGS